MRYRPQIGHVGNVGHENQALGCLRALGVCRSRCCRCHDSCNRRVTHLLNSFEHFLQHRKMNKHVGKLSKEASDARKMIDESESGDSDDSEGDDNKVTGKKNNIGAAATAGSGEKPTEEQVEKLEEKLEAAQGDQKNLFLIIFQVKSSVK